MQEANESINLTNNTSSIFTKDFNKQIYANIIYSGNLSHQCYLGSYFLILLYA